MTLALRTATGRIDLVMMGYTHTDDRFGASVATLPVINPDPEQLAPKPRVQYKYGNLDDVTLRGEIWPVSDQPIGQWRALTQYLKTEPDPILRLTEEDGGVEGDRGYFYATSWSLEQPDIVQGQPGIRRWRLTLRETQPPGQNAST